MDELLTAGVRIQKLQQKVILRAKLVRTIVCEDSATNAVLCKLPRAFMNENDHEAQRRASLKAINFRYYTRFW